MSNIKCKENNERQRMKRTLKLMPDSKHKEYNEKYRQRMKKTRESMSDSKHK